MPKKEIETKKETVKKTPAKTTTTKKAATAKKAPAKKTAKEVNPIEKILTPANSENVILYNDKNEPMEFEQIALIPYEKNLYCILRPLELKGIDQDEAVVFLIQEENDNVWLDVVEDDETVDEIFDIYYKLYEEATKTTK